MSSIVGKMPLEHVKNPVFMGVGLYLFRIYFNVVLELWVTFFDPRVKLCVSGLWSMFLFHVNSNLRCTLTETCPHEMNLFLHTNVFAALCVFIKSGVCLQASIKCLFSPEHLVSTQPFVFLNQKE